MAQPSSFQLTLLQHEADIERVIALEAASYPPDEAASADKIRFRQQHAGAFFFVATLDASVIGFVNGTLSVGATLSEHTMSDHDPLGTTLCIHSVVVDASLRRQKIATHMLREYVRIIVNRHPQVERIALISKAPLIAFYVACGFTVTRLSPVVHGNDPWFELVLDCGAARRLSVVQVDAFSAKIFDGNPAAVVVMSSAMFNKEGATVWMQNVAKENNLSETAYVAPHQVAHANGTDGIVEYDLRWFTPQVEVSLCGHATLSSAFVLYEEGHVTPTATIHFHTLSGVLVCKMEKTADGKKWIQMDFPVHPLHDASPDLSLATLAAGLGLTTDDFIAIRQTQTSDVLVHIPTDRFGVIEPNFDLLKNVDARGIVVTSTAPETGVDFQSRFFGPRVGVPEDPVTGSAHCALAVYWSNQLNKVSLYAHQACPLRGGYVSIELPSDQKDRVLLKGEAVISLRGTLETLP